MRLQFAGAFGCIPIMRTGYQRRAFTPALCGSAPTVSQRRNGACCTCRHHLMGGDMTNISRVSRQQLILAVQPVNGRVPTLQAVADIFGLSRERIRQRLDDERLVKPFAPHSPKAAAGDWVTIRRVGRSGADVHAGHRGRIVRDTRSPTGQLVYVAECECGSALRLRAKQFDKGIVVRQVECSKEESGYGNG